MKIKDGLNLLNLTQTQIDSYFAGIFEDEGDLLYNSTNKQVVVNNGTSCVPVGGGKEPYITEQKIWMHQILGDTELSQNTAINTTITEIKGTPIMFQQDVKLNKVVADSWSTQTGNKGHIGIYELISKSIQGGVEYYQFDLLQKFTPTFIFNALGVQEITLSPAYTMLAGKVYVIAFLLEQVHATIGSQQVVGRFKVPHNRFLGLDYRVLETTTTQAYNPFTNNLPTSMPSSLYMYPVSNQNTSSEPFSIKIQNA